MNRFLISYFLLSILLFVPILDAGFPAHCLIKTKLGFSKISLLKECETVLCPDVYGFNKEVSIKQISKTIPSYLYTITCDHGSFDISGDHKVYDPVLKVFIEVSSLTTDNYLIDSQNRVWSCKLITKKSNNQVCYDLFLESPHIFYASELEILVHNFMVEVGLTFAFGGGEVVFTGITAAVAFLGVLLGIKKATESSEPAEFEISYIGSFNDQDSSGGSEKESEGDHKNNNDPNKDPKKNKDDDGHNNNPIFHKDKEPHIFEDRKGHLPDTPENRKLISNTASNRNNFQGTDQHGSRWYANTLSNGKQIWARVRNGKITNAGINDTPRVSNPTTGLCRFSRPK